MLDEHSRPDYTGTNPLFKITNEVIQKESLVSMCCSLSMGAFYVESLILIDQLTNIELKKGTDYIYEVMDVAASGHASKEVYTVLKFTRPLVNNIAATYQYVGANHIHQRQTIIDLLAAADTGILNEIYYSQLLNRPTTFNVTEEHVHDSNDVVGRDDEVAAMLAIRQAIATMSSELSLSDRGVTITNIWNKLNDLDAGKAPAMTNELGLSVTNKFARLFMGDDTKQAHSGLVYSDTDDVQAFGDVLPNALSLYRNTVDGPKWTAHNKNDSDDWIFKREVYMAGDKRAFHEGFCPTKKQVGLEHTPNWFESLPDPSNDGSTTFASYLQAKTAQDTADAAIPRAGGTFTGNVQHLVTGGSKETWYADDEVTDLELTASPHTGSTGFNLMHNVSTRTLANGLPHKALGFMRHASKDGTRYLTAYIDGGLGGWHFLRNPKVMDAEGNYHEVYHKANRPSLAELGITNVPDWVSSTSDELAQVDGSNVFANIKAVNAAKLAANTYADELYAKLLGDNPLESLDTIKELGDMLGDNTDAATAISTKLATHIAAKSNPHGTTLTDLGIPNVPAWFISSDVDAAKTDAVTFASIAEVKTLINNRVPVVVDFGVF